MSPRIPNAEVIEALDRFFRYLHAFGSDGEGSPDDLKVSEQMVRECEFDSPPIDYGTREVRRFVLRRGMELKTPKQLYFDLRVELCVSESPSILSGGVHAGYDSTDPGAGGVAAPGAGKDQGDAVNESAVAQAEAEHGKVHASGKFPECVGFVTGNAG